MKRRSKVSQATLVRGVAPAGPGLRIGEAKGLVAPIPDKTATVTLRLSGAWLVLWERLRASLPGLSDAEILRQGVAMRMATAAFDAKGKKPEAVIRFYDETGTLQEVDLESYVGIQPEGEDS